MQALLHLLDDIRSGQAILSLQQQHSSLRNWPETVIVGVPIRCLVELETLGAQDLTGGEEKKIIFTKYMRERERQRECVCNDLYIFQGFWKSLRSDRNRSSVGGMWYCFAPFFSAFNLCSGLIPSRLLWQTQNVPCHSALQHEAQYSIR